MKLNIISLVSLCFLIFLGSCENMIEEEVFSDLTEENFLTTEAGISAVLNQAYVEAQQPGQFYEHRFSESAINSGIAYGTGGSFQATTAIPFHDFTWDSNYYLFSNRWNSYYRGIRNANIIIDNLTNNESLSLEFKTQTTAEAKALRGYFYSLLIQNYGPIPLLISTQLEEFQLPRSSEIEIQERIEIDLLEAIDVLPETQNLYGKYTKGTALAILCRHYMNTKQWQKAAETAKDIMDLNQYELYPDYVGLFGHDNEQNSEAILVHPRTISINGGSTVTAMMTPPDVPLLPNQGNYAMRLLVYDEFIDSFHESDQRKDLFVTQYINKSGDLVQGYGNDKTYINKYPPDPNGSGFGNGIDFMEIRYASILLYRAEALNELNGPTQEAIDLINMVRSRAKVPLLSVGDFDQSSLRAHILNERLWELWFEAGEREDLIRNGTFISRAQGRGVVAADYHVLYPIPQDEVDTNTKLEQNPGY